MAQNDSLLKDIFYNEGVIHVFSENLFTNPALKRYNKQKNLTYIGLSGIGRIQNKHLYNYKGKNSNAVKFNATGKVKIKDVDVWGEALYLNKKIGDKRWSDVANTEFINPYLIADTVGGDSFIEKYKFIGGVNFQDNKTTYGGELMYNAEYHHGETDPRPFNKVIDVKATFGVARQVLDNSVLGASVYYDYYRQNVSVRSYKEERKDYFYYLRGFGQYHRKLSGSEKAVSNNYISKSYGLSLEWYNLDEQNYFIQYKIEKGRVDQDHSNLYIPFFYNSISTELTLAKKFIFYDKALIFKIIPSYYSKKGTEVIYERVKVGDTPVRYDWQPLSESQRYTSKKSELNLYTLFITPTNMGRYNDFTFSLGISRKEEKFRSPNLYYKYSTAKIGLEHGYNVLNKSYVFSVRYGANYHYVFNAEDKVLNNTAPEKAFVHDIRNEMKSVINFNLAFKIDYMFNNSGALYFIPKLNFYGIDGIDNIKIWNVSLTTGIAL